MKRLWYLLLIPFVLFFHYELILTDSILYRDDFQLLSAIVKTSSLSDYFTRLFQGFYLDIQPVRDFTFFLNLKLRELFGYGGFHLTNLTLAGLITLNFRKILKFLKFNETTIFMVIALLAVHPVLNSAAGWVSNRKHLLSIFFILLYVNQSLKEENGSWKSVLYVLLSFLSQPITILIPGLVVIYGKIFEKHSPKAWDYGIVALTISIFVLNIFLYNNPYFAERSFTDSFQLELAFLHLSRVVCQVFFPVSIAMEYDAGNILSKIGIPLTIITILLILKFRRSWKEIFLIMIGLSPLFTVMKWGPRDGYLLSTLMVTGYLLSRVIGGKNVKKTGMILLPIFLYFCFESRKFTPMWQNDLLLGKVSSENEGGFINYSFFSIQLAKAEPDNCLVYLQRPFVLYPGSISPQMMFLRAKCIYDSRQTDEEKLAVFRKEANPDLFAVFYEAKLLEKLGEVEKSNNAYKSILKSMQDPAVKNLFWDKMCIKEKNERECNKLQELSR